MRSYRLRALPAVRALRGGGVIAYPTEAVFGFGCDPCDADAVARLLVLKQRAVHQGLIIIAADVAQLRAIIRPLPPPLAERVLASWPGPVTWLLPARPGVPRWLRGRHRLIAVRVTAHPPTVALCRSFGGALVSTSANRSGHRACTDAACVRRRFGAAVDAIAPGVVGGRSAPSRIVDAASGNVVRA